MEIGSVIQITRTQPRAPEVWPRGSFSGVYDTHTRAAQSNHYVPWQIIQLILLFKVLKHFICASLSFRARFRSYSYTSTVQPNRAVVSLISTASVSFLRDTDHVCVNHDWSSGRVGKWTLVLFFCHEWMKKCNCFWVILNIKLLLKPFKCVICVAHICNMIFTQTLAMHN